MGDGDVSPSSKKKTYTEYFNELCPYYLSYGMSHDQFWNGDPMIAGAYRKKYRIEQERMNFEAWLNGMYVYQAMSTVLSNAFSKNGSKEVGYMDKPIDLFPKKLTEEEYELECEKKTEEMVRRLEAMFKNSKKE